MRTTNNELPDIRKTIIIDAPIQKVWDRVSTAEGIASWFMNNDFVPEVGHEFHLQSPFGPSPCKVTDITPPNRLSFSWDTDGWHVTFLLKEIGEGRTEFTLIHGGWKSSDEIVAKAGKRTDDVRDTMSGGWTGIVAKLKDLAEG